jgi:arsenate reductase
MEFWHNPRCRKSREALALLTEKGVSPTVREYLKEPPSEAELREVIAKLGLGSARDLMRKGEADYRDQGLKDVTDEAALIKAMAATPKLIERPVLINGDKAAIGRPPERVLTVL